MLPILALTMIAVLPPQLPGPAWGGPLPLGRSILRHADARATATVEIIVPAMIGGGYGAPRPGMIPRATSVSVDGGPARTLLVYDFE